ncbi:ribokinase [Candidatus Kaiserbacteria bacterium CG10_big_fil_rev_8_21_14_0_10_51_14]|uniref:Ribokinase n=1 Tax=Candidatus Kaiserbacteria bacterium CG10_big_fil_rev_8_21_14_0_10_51_14 TaxID=1974610 RepID=A0A2H0UB17_9BACT|nr:MAG: ribokinase [Candidatus Kaiserbacteria bacterium CG10_big_fil_rev_8_21_14_0_10_51_14]
MAVDRIPTGDEKVLARDYAVSFGGNAVTAAFCCAHLGFVPDLLCNSTTDWSGRMFADMVRQYGLYWHERRVARFSVSFIHPINGQRTIERWRDEDYLHGFPHLNLDGCKAVHVDGLQIDAALHYLREARNRKILTSLDGGSLRENMEELLSLTDIAIVSERLCEQMGLTPEKMLKHLHRKGCVVRGVTLGERGMLWAELNGESRILPALSVPASKVVDTSGAGDVFHGAYIYSYLTWSDRPWEDHFRFARAAAAHAVQHLGNEASLPSVADVETAMRDFSESRARAA